MSNADLWAYLVTGTGAAGAVLYAGLTLKARVPWNSKMLGFCVAFSLGYGAALWGGQLAGLWVLTAEWARPALFMAYVSLLALGLLSFGKKP